MKRRRNRLKTSQQQIVSSTKTTMVSLSQDLYLPDECWEHVFKFILNNNNYHKYNCCYLDSLSLVSKQFLSITNRLQFSLSIYYPNQPFLLQLFQRFTNLTSLDLTHFQGDLDALLSQISCLPFNNFNLKSLNLSKQYKFPTKGLRDFSKKIKTLTSLTCSKFYSFHNDDLVLIADCFPFLEELDLSNIRPFNNQINDVRVDYMSTAFPKLRKVNLSAIFYAYDSLLLNLSKNCEFLEELIINCELSTQDGIASAIHERPTLRSLSIKRWPNRSHDIIIGSQFIESLVSLKSLTCLDLSYSCISDELLSSIAFRGLPLKRLVLNYCNGYSYDGIFCLLSKCRCIQHLDLQDSRVLNDKHVVKLSTFLGDLASINLSDCIMLTESSLFALASNCYSLSEIKMMYTGIGERSVKDSNSTRNLVVNPRLKSLHLAHNSCLRNEHIIKFASIYPNLQFLDLSHCNGISEGIGEVLKCCKIRHLRLAYCSRLLRMNFKVSTLEVLNLSGSKIDDRSLYAISKSCFGLLQIDLRHCKDITGKGVMEIVEKCTKLREINLDYCHIVDANIVMSMVLLRPSLRKITCQPCFRHSDSRLKVFLKHGCLVC